MRPDLNRCDPRLLDLPDRVVSALLAGAAELKPESVMLVGARCRDILHSALGYERNLPLTSDVDVGLALEDLGKYEDIIRPLDVAGNSGIRYLLADVPTDLMPFGDVEDPVGVVTPNPRGEELSVWSFREVFSGSLSLALPGAGKIRIPTVEGYAALKLAAWLDRSEYGEFKDARDLAICVHWYADSKGTEDLLYEEPRGQNILVRFGLDLRLAAAYLLGTDIARLIGRDRVADLARRWPGESRNDLASEFLIDPATAIWPRVLDRRAEILVALEEGWLEAAI
jgi:predicted nucleotidyltransferase